MNEDVTDDAVDALVLPINQSINQKI